MDGGATSYILMAAMAAGTVVETTARVNENKERQRVLEEELRSAELAALDEENQRLLALREANESILAGAGGIDAYASPSLIASREFNFRMGMQDIANTRLNIAQKRSATAARIGILKDNTRATRFAGLFELAGIGAATVNKSKLLSKGSKAKGAAKTGSKGKSVDG